MKRWHMLTVVGRDRPGIVAALADVLFRGGTNLGEAAMTRLGGNFTVMLMVEADAGDAAALERMLGSVAHQYGLYLHVDAIDGSLHQHVEPNARIIVHGADRPGIVAQVTKALLETGFNILDLESDVGGTLDKPIYIMMLDGHIAGGVDTLKPVVEPLRRNGIEVRIADLDTLLG